MDHFSTDRLTAERLNETHLADLVALHLDSEVSRYLGGVRSAEITRTYLATNMAHWDRYGFGLWVLRTQDGAFAGRAGIRHTVIGDVDEIEIAYTFTRDLNAGWPSRRRSPATSFRPSRWRRRRPIPSSVGRRCSSSRKACRNSARSPHPTRI